MDKNTYMIIDAETNRVLAQHLPQCDMIMLLSLLCQYAPEVRDYTIAHDYFEEAAEKMKIRGNADPRAICHDTSSP